MLVIELIDSYINKLYERNKNGKIDINTVADHIEKIESGEIYEYFKQYKISELNTSLIEEFINYLRTRPNKNNAKKKISERRITNIIRTLTAIIHYGIDNNWLKENPILKADNKPEPNKFKNKKELNYFNIDEAIYALKCIDKYADIRLKTFLTLIFSLGCRREECCGLRWKDIDFKSNYVDYNYAVTSSASKRYVNDRVRVKDLKTDTSYRTNILSESAIKNLKNYYKFKKSMGYEINEEDFIFTNIENFDTIVDPNKLSEQWRNFKKQYNIKNVDLHRIRHSVAKILEDNGIPKKDIAKMIGNTERVLEMYYTHVDKENLKKMRNTIDYELFNEVNSVELNIELVTKILNDYPFNNLSNDDLIKLDYICEEKITNDNFTKNLKLIKQAILIENPKLNYFIDDDYERLETKIETFNFFYKDEKILIKKLKDVSIRLDVFSLE